MGFKRSQRDMEDHRKLADGRDSDTRPQPRGQQNSPYMPMFEHFRSELDEHHDRREKVITASREITRMSKKMCDDPLLLPFGLTGHSADGV